MTTKLVLYDHPVSSYAQKVRIALREKGLEFEKVLPQNAGTGQRNDELFAANPRSEVPALIDGEFKIFDSTTILAYLDEKYPERPLLPATPEARAEARMIADIAGTQYEAINWSIAEIKFFHRATGEQAETLLARAKEQTVQMQTWLVERLGSRKFFNGDTFGYADIGVAPMLNRSAFYELGPEPGSPLDQWLTRIKQLPSVAETFEEMLVGTKRMAAAGPSMFKPHGGVKRQYRDHRVEWMIKNGGINIVQKGIEDENIRFSWPQPQS